MIADPYIFRDSKDKPVIISGNIDQGGATSENNRAIQFNVNIIVTKDLEGDNYEKLLKAVKNTFGDEVRTVMI